MVYGTAEMYDIQLKPPKHHFLESTFQEGLECLQGSVRDTHSGQMIKSTLIYRIQWHQEV